MGRGDVLEGMPSGVFKYVPAYLLSKSEQKRAAFAIKSEAASARALKERSCYRLR